MTAVENAIVARHCRTTKGIFGAILHTPSQKREETWIREKALFAVAMTYTAYLAIGVEKDRKRS